MRKLILATTFLAVSALATACGGGERDVSVDTERPRPELLYLGSATGLTALAPTHARARDQVRYQQAAAVPSRDWSVLYTATNDGVTTTLRTLDPSTGQERSHRTVPGVFAVRTVSDDGAVVALTSPPPAGYDA